MSSSSERFFLKASVTEIYNERIKDLLNPGQGALQCRWNVKNGFFVEDLTIVECGSVDDLLSVMHEGLKNRKVGKHDMNKDSSRSHTILTLYLVSEDESGD